MISYCSSIPGGTFMPILVLGALMGTIFATVFIHLGLIPTDNYTNIIIVSMAAYLGGNFASPIYRNYFVDRNDRNRRTSSANDYECLYCLSNSSSLRWRTNLHGPTQANGIQIVTLLTFLLTPKKEVH